MTALASILAGARPIDGGFGMTIPEDWLQGRTAYGGLSTALALHAAKAGEAELPPLRSALVAFVGPLAGEVTVTAQRLRRGRNAAFVEASIASEAGLGFRATFVFMAEVDSSVAHDSTVPTPHPPPAADADLYTGPAPYFTSNFNFLDLKDAAGPTEWLRWGRLIERDGLDPEVSLMAIADALPPAAMRMMTERGPVSSLTWIVNMLAPRPETRDGWWLLSAATDRAVGGYSSQRMTIWSADGAPVVDAMQGVVIFA